jgi:hypothetical protein
MVLFYPKVYKNISVYDDSQTTIAKQLAPVSHMTEEETLNKCFNDQQEKLKDARLEVAIEEAKDHFDFCKDFKNPIHPPIGCPSFAIVGSAI